MGIFSAISSGLQTLAGVAAPAVAPVIAGLFGSRDTDKTNEANSDAVKAQNASNEKIAAQNLQFQRENLDYQKALQQKIFDREDSSYARTVADMRAAGLNPLTMNGTNQAGAVVPTEPLHNEYQAAAFTGRQPKNFSWIAQLPSYYDIKKQKAEADIATGEAKFNEDTEDDRKAALRAELQMKILQNISQQYDNADKFRRELFDSYFEINSGMSEKERSNKIISKLFNSDSSYVEDKNSIFGHHDYQPGHNWQEGWKRSPDNYDGTTNDFSSSFFPSSFKTFNKVYGASTAAEGIGDILKDIIDVKNLFKAPATPKPNVKKKLQ